jgi:hypothetical protein
MRSLRRWLLATIVILSPAVTSAQSEERDSSLFWDITKHVVFDPTTYAPAALAYTSMRMDWDSSQTLFRHGWYEQNYRFTVTGQPNDRPISFTDGNRKIRHMALLHLQESVINNVAVHVFERVLADRYPQHRKLFKTLSWVERIAFASYVSYLASANHFRQAQYNNRLATQHGYR